MKKIKTLCLLLITILFIGCREKMTINDNYTKIVEYSSQTSWGMVEDFYELHLCVNNNNTIEIYGTFDENGIEIDYIDGIIVNITEEEKNEIISIINKNNYMTIPNNVGTKSSDGSYHYLRFYDESGDIIKECSGLNPTNKRFCNIEESISKCVSKEDIELAKENIKKVVHEEFEKKYENI